MRNISKYKILKKSNVLLFNFPYKILKFRSSKWKLFQKTFKKSLKRNAILNSLKGSAKSKIWEKKKKNFKKSLQIKRNLTQIFDTTFNFKFVKKQLSILKQDRLCVYNIIQTAIIKFEFRLDILLRRLFFFSSFFEARKIIKAGKILINGIIIKEIKFLKKGDIVQLKDFKSKNKYLLTKEFRSSFFFSFIEVDYYSGCFVVVKDLKEFDEKDISLIVPTYIDAIKLHRIIYKT